MRMIVAKTFSSESRGKTYTRDGVIHEANHRPGCSGGRPGCIDQVGDQVRSARKRASSQYRPMRPGRPADPAESEPDPKTTLMAKYATEPPAVRELVARVADQFGRTSQTVERTDGLATALSCSTVWTWRRSSFTKNIPLNFTVFGVSSGKMPPPISCFTGENISE